LPKANANAKTEKTNATIDRVDSVDCTVALVVAVILRQVPLALMVKFVLHMVQLVALLHEAQLVGQAVQLGTVARK